MTPLMASAQSVRTSSPAIRALTAVSTSALMDVVSSMEISMTHNPRNLSAPLECPPPLDQSQRPPILQALSLRPILQTLSLRPIPQAFSFRPILQALSLRSTLLTRGVNVVVRTGVDLLHVVQVGPVCTKIRTTISACGKDVTSAPTQEIFVLSVLFVVGS